MGCFAVGFLGARWSDARQAIASPQQGVESAVGADTIQVDESTAAHPSSESTFVESLDELPDIEARVGLLRNMGFPDDAILSLLNSANWEAAEIEHNRDWPMPDYKWWRDGMYRRQLPDDVSKRLGQLSRALQSELGGLPMTAMDYRSAQQRFGDLSPEKLRKMRDIRLDYRQMEGRIRGEEGPGMEEALALLRREWERDVQAVLTPEELAEYQLRSSPGVRQLGNRFREIDISVEEFESLIPTWSQESVYGNPEYRNAPRSPAASIGKMKIDAQVWATLGAERFWQYKEQDSDRRFNELRRFTDAESLSRDETLAIWAIRMEMEAGVVPDVEGIVGSDGTPTDRLIGILGEDRFEKAVSEVAFDWLTKPNGEDGE